MYKAYLNNKIFFDSSINDDALSVEKASIKFEANKAGGATFVVPTCNAEYDRFLESEMTGYIVVYQDDEAIFSGRVFSISKNVHNFITAECEGALAFLNDTIYRPNDYHGSLAGLVSDLLSKHNLYAEDVNKQIQLGEIEVEDDYLNRTYETYETTLSRLNDLQKSYGGYIVVRRGEYDRLVLDWYEDFVEEATQEINFGENLLDIKQESDASEIATVIVPLGAEQEMPDGTKQRVNISGIPEQDGKDYVVTENEESLLYYGKITKTQIWDDVNEPLILLTKAQNYVNEKSVGQISINITALDLAGTSYGQELIDHFKIGQKIYVRSTPHRLSEYFICQKQNLDLLSPANNKLTLGKTSVGYIGQNKENISQYARVIDIINSSYARNERVNSIETTVIQHSTLIEQNSREISLKASQQQVDEINTTINGDGTDDNIGLIEKVKSIEAELKIDSAQIGIYFGKDGKITSWFTFEDDKFKIGTADSPIHSEQTSQSYQFVDKSGNVLLEINPQGTVSKTVNVDTQIRYMHGNQPQWATRKGALNSKGYNMNDLWIGG